MKPEQNEDFYLEVQKYWKSVVHKAAVIDPLRLHQQLEIYRRLFNIFQAGDYYFLLFDIYHGTIAEASAEMMTVLGFDPQVINMAFFMDHIHPQDMPYFLTFERQVTDFFNQIPVDKICHYKVQYDLRVRKKDGHYARLLIQYVVVNHEERNIYHSLHVHTDITHIQKNSHPNFSIIGLHGEPSFYNIQDGAITFAQKLLFTDREREILKAIVEGLNSNEIAKLLCLSIHTINSHRKNILAKAAVKTPLQLIKKSIEEGWI